MLLTGEKAEQLKRSSKAAKTNKKVKTAQKEGKVTKKKFKGIRIRKGLTVKVHLVTCTLACYFGMRKHL